MMNIGSSEQAQVMTAYFEELQQAGVEPVVLEQYQVHMARFSGRLAEATVGMSEELKKSIAANDELTPEQQEQQINRIETKFDQARLQDMVQTAELKVQEHEARVAELGQERSADRNPEMEQDRETQER